MKLEFRRLIISNFKSFLDEAVLDFSALGPGLVFIRGENRFKARLESNGAGKSSLWDALVWCPYGRTVKGLRNPDIRPWQSDGTTTVSLVLAIDGAEHTLTRTAAPNRLTWDDQDIGQEDVVKNLGMDYEVFMHTVLFGQGRRLFFDLKPQDKMDLFSEVLQLDRWEQWSSAASRRVTGLEKSLTGITADIINNDKLLEQFTGMLKSSQDSYDQWETETAEAVKERSTSLAEAEKKLASAQAKLDKASLDYDGASVELKAQMEATRRAREALQMTTTTLNAHEVNKKAAERQLITIEKELAGLGKGGKCPTCGQSLNGTTLGKHKSNLETQIAALQREIANAIPRSAVRDKDKAEAEVSQSLEHESFFQDRADKARNSMDYLTNVVGELTGTVKHLKHGLDDLIQKGNPHSEQVQKLKKRVEVTKDKKKELDETEVKITREIENTKVWVKGFKDIALDIINETLEELEIITNSMLEDIGLSDWSVRYVVERETKSGTVKRGAAVLIRVPESPEDVRWESWSGGEGQRLRLVGSLALAQVLLNQAGIEIPLEILDEPTAGLTRGGATDLCDVLADRAEALGRLTFFVDHRTPVTSRFTSTLLVTKDENGSSLEVL